MESPVSLVIFDMDDVLCNYDRPRRIGILSEISGVPADEIDAAIWRSGFDDDADRGGLDVEQYLTEFQRRMGYPISRVDWIEARAASMTPFPDVLAMARRVGEKVPLALLTNNGPLLEDAFDEVFPEAARLFAPNVFFSYSLGVSKPEPEAFKIVVERMGGRPETTLFIDDSAEYLVGATEAGLITHHFTGSEGLRARLMELGLL